MYLGLLVALSLFFVTVKAKTEEAPKGIIAECRERYLAVQVRLNNGESEPHFEAVDISGVYPITEEYGRGCGYTYQLFSELGIAELRASYFSCHTGNQGDKEFTFNFNLIMTDQHGEQFTYTLTKLCALPLPWSPREVICEMDYLEVNVLSTVPYPSTGGTIVHQHWNAVISTAHSLASSAWQLMFLKEGQRPTSLSLSEARELGYRLDFTSGRVLFRTPYGTRFSDVTVMNGVPVEVIQAVLFSRQSWTVVIFDLVATCSSDVGSFDGAILQWQIPIVPFPSSSHTGFASKNISIGVNGRLLDPQITADRGYVHSIGEEMVDIGIPYGAEGGYKQSFVLHNTYWEFYMIRLYYEGVFMDEFHAESRQRETKVLMTPLLPLSPFTRNQTILEEREFTVYWGNYPSDVKLVTVSLNGHNFTVVKETQSGFTIVNVPHTNGTHGYVIRVPFENPIVLKWYFTEGVLQYSLHVNFTFMLQEDYFFHFASFEARIHDVYPPSFSGQCKDNGIVFKLDHKEFDHMWDITIGKHLLTEQFAKEQGYLMVNDSQSLLLDVPLFTPGYVYEDVNLHQFFGTFEILSRDAKTQEIQQYSAKRCPFQTPELVVCSTEGVMTVVADVVRSVPKAIAYRTTLLDPTCKPKEANETRVLFEFELQACGTQIKIKDEQMFFENVIVFEQEHIPSDRAVITRDATFRLTVRCSYPVEDVNMDMTFKSTAAGLGSLGVVKPHDKALVESFQLTPPEVVAPASVPIIPGLKAPPVPNPAQFVRVHSQLSARKQRR